MLDALFKPLTDALFDLSCFYLGMCAIGVVVMLIVGWIGWKMQEGQRQQEAEMKRNHPEIWLKAKELEHQKEEKRRESTQRGIQAGAALGKFLANRYLN